MDDLSDKLKFQLESLNWLREMNLINHPQFINQIKLNIYTISKTIKNVELLVIQDQQSMLVYIELDWFSRRFRKKSIISSVELRLKELMPSYRFRVIDDRSIFELALKKAKQIIKGHVNDSSKNNN